ncbi:hypothetical protein TRVA0_059S00342 [Trichomonascus vanleenenianus]|uniref:uncharacterized protein n=1 Tax=Trichomonascus vanleenenianus TaxID=2268995 RepID=UPI003ECA9555
MVVVLHGSLYNHSDLKDLLTHSNPPSPGRHHEKDDNNILQTVCVCVVAGYLSSLLDSHEKKIIEAEG